MEAQHRASPPRPQKPGKFRMTRELYHRLGEQGAFEGLKVELLEGEIIVMPPMGSPHSYPVQELTHLLVRGLPEGLRVRTQLPIAPDDEKEPEPDVKDLSAVTSTAVPGLVLDLRHVFVKR